MLIKQVSVFIEQKKGSLADITQVISDSDIDLRAISVFDSSEYGILRMILSDPYKAVDLLKETGHVAQLVDVIAVEPRDEVGAMNAIFTLMSSNDINVEYVYSFVMKGAGTMPLLVMKTDDQNKAVTILKESGIIVLPKEDVY